VRVGQASLYAAIALLVLGGCANEPFLPLNAVYDRHGRIALDSDCVESLNAEIRRELGQVVVTHLDGRRHSRDNCDWALLPVDVGPDVVYPKGRVRYAFLGGEYRRVDYCGVSTRRCVPVPTGPVNADCTRPSLRYATIGVLGGVFPFHVRRCEDGWARVDLETCHGYDGEEEPSCTGTPRRLLFQVDQNGRWWTSGIDVAFLCAGTSKYSHKVEPEWTCKV
jgi:hypothetical protein